MAIILPARKQTGFQDLAQIQSGLSQLGQALSGIGQINKDKALEEATGVQANQLADLAGQQGLQQAGGVSGLSDFLGQSFNDPSTSSFGTAGSGALTGNTAGLAQGIGTSGIGNLLRNEGGPQTPLQSGIAEQLTKQLLGGGEDSALLRNRELRNESLLLRNEAAKTDANLLQQFQEEDEADRATTEQASVNRRKLESLSTERRASSNELFDKVLQGQTRETREDRSVFGIPTGFSDNIFGQSAYGTARSQFVIDSMVANKDQTQSEAAEIFDNIWDSRNKEAQDAAFQEFAPLDSVRHLKPDPQTTGLSPFPQNPGSTVGPSGIAQDVGGGDKAQQILSNLQNVDDDQRAEVQKQVQSGNQAQIDNIFAQLKAQGVL